MDNWVPNPNAKPYIPKKFRGHRTGVKGKREFTCTTRRCLSKTFQGGLVVVLMITLIINIMFILETNKKLKDPQHRDDDSSINYVMDSRGGNNVIERSEPRLLTIEVVSSKTVVSVAVDGTPVIQDEEPQKNRGIHIAVLNQATGSVMSKAVFDTYSQHEDESMINFIKNIRDGRILILTIKDEGSFQLKSAARQYLKEMGSEKVEHLAFRDTWIFITEKGTGSPIGESYSKAPDLASWGDRVTLETRLPLKQVKESQCNWPDDELSRRRQTFCNKVEGYGSVCSCDNPDPITFSPEPLENNNIADIPIAIIASDRPHYLYRMLTTLLSIPGANAKMVTVFIDGYFESFTGKCGCKANLYLVDKILECQILGKPQVENITLQNEILCHNLKEPLQVTKLLGLRGIQHTPLGVKNARVSQHYKASLTATFNLYPDAKYAIVIEEDLDVSPDFFNYFSQTVHLLEEDDTLYCVSAWNDQGYDHSCKDPSLLYRIETMPGLGWLLKRKLYKDELEPQWPTPEKQWDWDMWMRTNYIRKNRECIIPDISRTYHFGSKGLNMNPYFQEVYFQKHSFMKKSNVKLKDVNKMKRNAYEDVIKNLISSADVLDHTKDPCSEEFIPSIADKTFVMYIKMNVTTDYTTWKQLAKCYHLWDLDVRGFHKSMWRLFIKGNHVMMVGVPASAYSYLKPNNVVPINLIKPTEKT